MRVLDGSQRKMVFKALDKLMQIPCQRIKAATENVLDTSAVPI